MLIERNFDVYEWHTWSDAEIREKCRAGTKLELEAYLAAGLTLCPQPIASLPNSLAELLQEVAVKHKATIPQLKARANDRILVNARMEFAVRAYTELGQTTSAIGRFLGKRDHSSIIYLLHKAGVKQPTKVSTATHCKYGHELTPENTYHYPGYKRGCRICQKRHLVERRERLRKAKLST